MNRILFFLITALLPLPAFAAEIYFGTHTKEVGVNQLVEVGVFLNTEGEPINAIEGSVSFSSSLLAPEEIRNGNSIISFWLEQPFLERDGELRFSGVIPGGYTGSSGYLFSVIFQARQEGRAVFDMINARTLLNDGNGSEASFHSAPIALTIGSGLKGPEVLPVYDKDAPESFVPQIAQDPNLFDGKWFLVFATQDKGSGIDRYEVREQRRWKFLKFEFGIWPAKWVKAQSPYELGDQSLRSFVYVKAVDHKQNERIVLLEPQRSARFYEDYLFWIIIIGVVVLAGVIGRILWRKKT